MFIRKITCPGLALFLAALAVAEAPGIALVYTTGQMEALQGGKNDPLALYRAALDEYDAEVIVFSPSCDPADIAARKAMLDGVLLPGGVDVDPAFYGEEPHEKLEEVDLPLDRLQFDLLDHAREHGLPVLGICRGHQVINVFFGGSLYQDIPAQFGPIGGEAVTHRGGSKHHDITIEESTLMHALLGVTRIKVNTHHHQAVKKLGEGLRISARSDDGIVEAIEHEGDVFILGVQFHPERMRTEEPRVNALFARFVAEARALMRRRKPEGNEMHPPGNATDR